jgi:hypothetical protein
MGYLQRAPGPISVPRHLLFLPFLLKGSPGAKSGDGIRAFLIWFKEREPLRLGDIERIEAVLIQEHIGLHSLRTLPEARIAGFELPSGIVDRMKATISKWRAGG